MIGLVQMGASCSLTADALTTHLVAASRGTDKFVWAQRHGKLVVTPSWLTAASERLSTSVPRSTCSP